MTRVTGRLDDAELAALAERAGMVPLPGEGGLPRFSDMEVDVEIVVADGGFALVVRDRGSARQEMWTRSLDAARRYLVLKLASGAASKRPFPALERAAAGDALPAGFSLDETPEGAVLRWEHDGLPVMARFRTGPVGAIHARSFAAVASMTEREIAEALVAEPA